MTCQETKMFSRYLNFYKFSDKKNLFPNKHLQASAIQFNFQNDLFTDYSGQRECVHSESQRQGALQRRLREV